MKALLLRSRLEFAGSLSGLCIAFALAVGFYWWLDPHEILDLGVHLWDGQHYRSMAMQMQERGLQNLSGQYPFAPRLLFPWLASRLMLSHGLRYVEAACVINLASSFLLSLFSLWLFRRNGLSAILSWALVLLGLVSWVCPLRYSIYYAAIAYGFECLLVCLLYLALRAARRGGWWRLLMAVALVFALALGREFVLMITLMVAALELPARRWIQGAALQVAAWQVHGLMIAAAFCGLRFARYLAPPSGEPFSMLRAAISHGWFHLHVAEALYPFFFALGPFLLLPLLALSLREPRQRLLARLRDHLEDPCLVSAFGLAALLFALGGGTDSDRFLLWFLPFFALLAGHALLALVEVVTPPRRAFSFVVLAIGLLWSRCYVPAFPPLLFPEVGNYQAPHGLRANLNPDLYRGLPGLARWRLPLQRLSPKEAFRMPLEREDRLAALPVAMISANVRARGAEDRHSGSYRWDLNLIPFPLGFAHNQFEPMICHPTSGNRYVRFMILLQWLGLYLGGLLWLRREAAKRSQGQECC